MSQRTRLKDFVYAALFAAMIMVLGFIAFPLPFSPVPVTGQTLGIMLAGSILTIRQIILSISTFLLLGIAGVPVFAGGTGGIGIIAGPRGGYLIGFLVGAVVIALLRGKNKNLIRLGLANLAGGVVIVYIFGLLWLSHVTELGLAKAFLVGALPYIPGDLFKVLVATILAARIHVQIERHKTHG